MGFTTHYGMWRHLSVKRTGAGSMWGMDAGSRSVLNVALSRPAHQRVHASR
jgi:hypothetical protein